MSCRCRKDLRSLVDLMHVTATIAFVGGLLFLDLIGRKQAFHRFEIREKERERKVSQRRGGGILEIRRYTCAALSRFRSCSLLQLADDHKKHRIDGKNLNRKGKRRLKSLVYF